MFLLSERQKAILKMIIEDYTKPVGSKSICDILGCSSATVRHEMNDLEELGLLEKTHISSGRIPSSKGYRYYVDHLMQPHDLSEEALEKLEQIFKSNKPALTDSISKSLELISELTNCTIISLGNTSHENFIAKVEAIPVSDTSVAAIVVTDKGHVENRTVVFDEKIDILEIKRTVDLINKYIVGTPLEEVGDKLEFEVKPIIKESIDYQKKMFDAFYEFMSDVSENQSVHMAGRNNILKSFDDVDKIKRILDKFEDREFIKNIKEKENGINIYIGGESEFDPDVSIVKSKYRTNGEEGTIAIIGPKRMQYDRVASLLKYIVDNLEE